MSRHDTRLDDEIQFHIEQQTAKNIRDGMTPDEARRAALVQFGGVVQTREAVRDGFRFAVIADLWRDLRIALRTLRRAPSYALSTILTFGLGLGAAIAMFSVVNSVLLKPLPYPEADRIVRLYQLSRQGAPNNVSGPNYADWRQGTHSFVDMTLMNNWGRIPVAGLGEPRMLSTVRVSQRFFAAMRVQPATGRPFAASEYVESHAAVAVISAALAESIAPGGSAVGQRMTYDGDSMTVVGVMPKGFDYPAGTDVWLPFDEAAGAKRSRTAHNYSALARLADGVTLAVATSEISALSRALKARYGDGTWMFDAQAAPILDVMTGTSRASLEMLLAGSLLLLLVATANVSNMLVVRSASRRKEFAVQLALGATRGRLRRQLLAETLALCASGALVGFALASAVVRLFVAAGPASVPRLSEIAVDWTVAGYASLAVIAIAVGLTLVTALGTSSTTATPALSDQGRGASLSRKQTRLRELLIVGEVALTLVLLAGAGLLARSLANVLAIDPGFRTDNALVADLTMTNLGDTGGARRALDQKALVDRLAQLPGVETVGFINAFPIGPGGFANGQFAEMTRVDEFKSYQEMMALGPAITPRLGNASYRLANTGYFTAMGIPLLRGRLMDDGDGPNSPHVAVISDSLAKQKWPGQDPIGRYVQFGNMDGDIRGIRIVGIVGDVREITIEQAPPAILYVSYLQRPGQGEAFSLVVRGPEPSSIAGAVRQIAREIAPNAPVTIRSTTTALDVATGPRRFNAWLIGAFAVAAFVLAAIGVYGLVSFAVLQRTREMAIRMALGAQPGALVRLIVGRGVLLAGIGAAVGLAASFYAGRVAQDLLFQVRPADPMVLTGATVVLIAAVAVACYLPARRIRLQSPARTLHDG